MPPAELDFRLDGCEAVNERVQEAFWRHIESDQDMLTVLADHHTDGDQHSYYVLHNGAVTWGIPGDPQLVALHLQRDTDRRAFRFEHAEMPLPAMAQSWLIARGCPKDAIRLPPGMGTVPADDATRALEERLMEEGDHFALLTSYTDDDVAQSQTTVLLRALDERTPMPFRIVLEEVDTDSRTHTLREGGFRTFEAATEWWDNRWAGEGVPLPTAPPPAPRRALSTASARPTPAAPPRGRAH
ncbi:hypothetical protein ABZ769_33775 [Streptomyces olivoreticuli]